MNHWELDAHDKDTNELVYRDEGILMDDAFRAILPPVVGAPRAVVEMDMTLTTPIGDRWIKLRAAVRVACNQDESTIDRAGELTLAKVNEFVTVGVGIVAKAMGK